MNNIKSQVGIVKKEYRKNGEVKAVYYDNGDVGRIITRCDDFGEHKVICHEHIEDNVKTKAYQSILQDKTSSGKVRPWSKKKVSNMILADIYDYLANQSFDDYEKDYYTKRAERLRSCAVFLKFRVLDNNGLLKLKKMNNSCRVRLCPMCAWRRTLKISSHARKIFNYVETDEQYSNKYDYLLLTLTVPNCSGDTLSDTITHLMKSFDRLMKRRELKKIVKGWYRGLEVTFNKFEIITDGLYKRCKGYFDTLGLSVGDKNPNFNTYHPHFHVILCVPKSYLSNHRATDGYLSNEKWLQIWRECTRNNDITQVDVRHVRVKENKKVNPDDPLQKNGLINAICEVTKYTVKDKDFIITWDWDLSAECVSVLDKALANRRLIAWGGILKEIHKKLNLDDEIDGDLVNIDDDDIIAPESETITEISCYWHVGYNEYVIYDCVEKTKAQFEKEEQEEVHYREVKLYNKNVKPNRFDKTRNYDTPYNFKFDVPVNDEKLYKSYIKTKEKTKKLPKVQKEIKKDNQLLLNGLEILKLDSK